jgi:hypothetical protein
MPRLELVEIDSHGPSGVYEAVHSHYHQVPHHEQPAVLVGLPSTEDCEEIAPLVQQFRIPTFTVEAFGPFGETYSDPMEYDEIFRLVGPSSELVTMMSELMYLYNFSTAALVYDENVKVEEHIMHDLTAAPLTSQYGHESTFVAYHLESNSTAHIDELLDAVASRGVQTFLLLLEDQNKCNELIRRAYRRGIAGRPPSAEGFAWISASSYIPWEIVGAHTDHYLGMLSVEQHTYDDVKIHPFAELWHQTMPTACGLSPRSARFATRDRNHMPYIACAGLPNSYDAIAAVALAIGRIMGDHSYDPHLLEQCATFEPGPDLQSKSAILSHALHTGIAFNGLTGNFNRTGDPWAEKASNWEVTNLQDISGTTVDLMHWTVAEGFVEVFQTADRHLGGGGSSSGSGGRIRVNGRYVWPGNVNHKPEGIIHSPCEHVDCGFHGTCQNRMKVGRPSGWCLCDPGFIGRRCDIFYEPYVLVDHPGIVSGNETEVDVLLYVESLVEVNEDEEAFTVGMYEFYHWIDPRTSHLTAATYSLTEAQSLKEEGLLWLPEVAYDYMESQRRSTGTLTIFSSGYVDLLVHRQVVLNEPMQWESFPFQDQRLSIQVHPVDSDNVRLVSMGCYGARAPPICWYMRPPDGWLGLPATSWDANAIDRGEWLRLWTPVEVTKHESADGHTVAIDMTLKRDALPMLIRIIIPSFFLVCVSWAGFFITPTKLMPRFASSFISFLALQTFKSNVLRLTPGEASDLTWMDMYMSVVGQMMVYAVLENVYVQFVFEHHSEHSARCLDGFARKLFPINFILQLTVMTAVVMMCPGSCVNGLNIAMHIWVIAFLFVLIAGAYGEYKNSIRRILKHELARIKHLAQAHERNNDIMADLQINPRELATMFALADKDHSGYAEVAEILEWLDKELNIGEELVATVEEDLKTMFPEDFERGITAHNLADILRKIFACLAIPDSKSKDRLFRTLQASIAVHHAHLSDGSAAQSPAWSPRGPENGSNLGSNGSNGDLQKQKALGATGDPLLDDQGSEAEDEGVAGVDEGEGARKKTDEDGDAEHDFVV